jgi:hypothetical protein
MQANTRFAIGLLVSLAVALTAATAEEAHRAQGPHVHGLASLDLAWDGEAIQIGLESPAANLVGFEHRPETDADRAALDAAVATLKDGERLFRFSPEARCRLIEAGVESALPEGVGAEGQEAHADLDAEYRFECAEPGQLRQVEVGLFQAFPATRSIQVQYVGPKGQAAAELTAASPMLKL